MKQMMVIPKRTECHDIPEKFKFSNGVKLVERSRIGSLHLSKNQMAVISNDEYAYLCAMKIGFKSASAVPDKPEKVKIPKVKNSHPSVEKKVMEKAENKGSSQSEKKDDSKGKK